MKCCCLYCQWQRTDRDEDYYRWAAGRPYQKPVEDRTSTSMPVSIRLG